MTQIKIPKVTQSKIIDMMQPIALDLTAIFSIMKEDILQKIDEEKEPEEIINEIVKLFGGHNEQEEVS